MKINEMNLKQLEAFEEFLLKGNLNPIMESASKKWQEKRKEKKEK